MNFLLNLFLDLWPVNKVGCSLLKYGSSFPKAHTLAGHSLRKGFLWGRHFSVEIDQFFPSVLLSGLEHLCCTSAFHYNQLPLACYFLQGLCLNDLHYNNCPFSCGSASLCGALCKWEHFKMLIYNEPKVDWQSNNTTAMSGLLRRPNWWSKKEDG